MSRSRKKYAICGFTCKESDKKSKQKANRRFRRLSKVCTTHNLEKLPFRSREITNVWDFQKDGKQKVEFHSTDEDLKKLIRRK